jgi:carbon monoxide dehydrogenase subunit G
VAEVEFEVSCPPERVFDFLIDMEKVGSCVAGTKRITRISEKEAEWQIEVRAGLVAQSVTLRTVITESIRPQRISFEGRGMNVNVNGNVQISPLGEKKTKVSFTAKVQTHGPLSSLIDLVMARTQKKLADETVANVRKKIEELEMST